MCQPRWPSAAASKRRRRRVVCRITASLRLLCLVTGCGAALAEQAPDAARLVADVARTLEPLSSLSFSAEYHIDGTGGVVLPMGDKPQEGRIIMAGNGRFRVELLDPEGALEGLLLSDGQQVTEWSRADNAWTRYGAAESPRARPRMGLLVMQPFALAHAESWVGKDSALCSSLRQVIQKARHVRVSDEVVDGRRCTVLRLRARHSDPPLSANIEYAFFFDADSHLLLERREVLEARVLRLLSAGTQERETIYRNLHVNVALSADTFTFNPPEGSSFIAPDDPRFRANTPVGQPAPDLELPDIDGRVVRLAKYTGERAILLSFWSTACAPCLREMPVLCRLHEEFGDKGLAVVGVSLGDRRDKLTKFLKHRPLPFLVLHDANSKAEKAFFVRGIPHTVLIDKKGIVVRVWHGWSGEEQEKEIRDELAKLGIARLNEPGSPGREAPARRRSPGANP